MVTARRALPLLAAAAFLLSLAATPAHAKTTWLCNPGLKQDACRVSLTTTKVTPTGKVLGIDRIQRAKRPKFDCFYVYPTVSDQTTIQANRKVDDVLRSIALYQAARYTRDCRMYAPVYRQITLRGLLEPDKITTTMRDQGYADVLAAWREYLEKDNKGRGVVLIGHSQGTFVLKRLIAEQIDTNPKVRRKLISAVLLGGNVETKRGSDRGGTFKNVPTCAKSTQTGCVLAFSTFGETPPQGSRFGRAADATKNEVACTNPAALGGGPATVTSIYPSTPFAEGTIAAVIDIVGNDLPTARTPWIEVVGPYTARCVDEDGAQALVITPRGGAPALQPSPDAGWGLHLVDANIALGQLADVVRRQAATWVRKAS